VPNSWLNDPSDYIGGAVGVPVKITSGRRTPQHNALVGGVPNSDHLRGQAYDFVPQGMSMDDAASRLRASGIPTTKIINERDHIHVSYPAQGNMPQTISDDDLLKALTGGTPSKAAAPTATASAGQISDEQLLAALTGSAGKPAPAPGDAPPAQAKGVGLLEGLMTGQKVAAPKFGFTEDLTAKIPFARDIMSAGAAGLDMAGNALTGQQSPGFSSLYQSHMADFGRQQAKYEAANPNAAGAATVGSFLSTGPGAVAKLVAAKSLPALMAAGAKGGAAIGGLFGLGTPSEDNSVGGRVGNALTGAATGALTGGALPLAGAGLGAAGRQVGRVTNKLFPSVEEVASKKAKGIIDQFAGGSVTPVANEIVPGSKPTLAEATGNAGVASLTRALRDLNPNSPLVAREGQNAAARLSHLETAAGTPEEAAALVAARDKAATSNLKAVFDPVRGQAADIAPLRQQISDILAGPNGARSAVKTSMKDVLSVLDNEGKPITDPEKLYHSVRKEIGDLISGKDLTKSYGKQAAAELISVRDALDGVIEQSAPGFKKYLNEYAQASAPITSMEFLQGLNLTDAQGKITLSKVQNAIKRLEAQKAGAGVKAGKAVTDTQAEALKAIRDDLLRAQHISLGKAIGSNTVQNLTAQRKLGILDKYGPEGIGATIGGGIGVLTHLPGGPEIGAGLGARVGNVLGKSRLDRLAKTQELTQANLEDMLLNPARYQNPSVPPKPIASLNDILNSSRARASMGVANRLAIMHELGAKKRANAP